MAIALFAFGVDPAWTLANQGRAADIAHPEVVDDIVDEIIQIVLAKGGRATSIPDGTLALRERLAMALR